MDVESMQEWTASIIQVTMQCMKTWALLPLLYTDRVFQLHGIATTLVQDF